MAFQWKQALGWGLVYWAFYGAVEYAATDFLAEVLRPQGVVPYASYWWMGLAALAVLVAVGTVFAAVGAWLWCLVLRPKDEAQARVRMTASPALQILAVYGYLLGVRSQGLPALVLALLVPLGLGVVAALGGFWPRWARWTWFVVNPVTLSLAVLVRPWMYFHVFRGEAPLYQMSVSSAVFGVLLAVSWLVLRGRPHGYGARGPAMAAMAIAGLAAAGGFGWRARVPLDSTPAEGARARRPNVLLITLDTVRADHLSLYGYGRQTTPHLDEFARQATVYHQAVAAASWTAPSHAAMMTGIYALRHGVRYDYPQMQLGHLPPWAPTLAETLHQEGYQTAAVVANHAYLAAEIGFGRGFDVYEVPTTPVVLEGSRMPSALRSARLRLMGLTGADLPYVDSGTVVERMERLLDAVRSAQPAFLFMNVMDAHFPYNPPAPFKNRFLTPKAEWTSARYYETVRQVDSEERGLTELEKTELMAAYDSGIAYADQQLSELFRALRARGLWDNTMIIVTADHGEVFGERSLMEHGVSVYEDQVHVPLIVKYPGQRQRQDVMVPVSLVDLYPTVLDVLKLPAPRWLAGVTLRAADKLAERPVYAEAYPLWQKWGVLPRFLDGERAVFRGSWKLVLSEKGRRALYDLKADPDELNDAQGRQPAQTAELEHLLRSWTLNFRKQGEDLKGLSPEAVERLKSLGYVQ